jgi:hypothetical protein
MRKRDVLTGYGIEVLEKQARPLKRVECAWARPGVAAGETIAPVVDSALTEAAAAGDEGRSLPWGAASIRLRCLIYGRVQLRRPRCGRRLRAASRGEGRPRPGAGRAGTDADHGRFRAIGRRLKRRIGRSS